MTRQAIVTFDLSAIASVRELHGIMARTLGVPDWYGPNWDAFWDVIIGLVEMRMRRKSSIHEVSMNPPCQWA